jgi:hypothetical protein
MAVAKLTYGEYLWINCPGHFSHHALYTSDQLLCWLLCIAPIQYYNTMIACYVLVSVDQLTHILALYPAAGS